MELDFDNDEFESFLKQKADQYQMYPSERVWKGIAFIQHSRTRLITIGGSLLLISVFFFFGGHFLTDQNSAGKKGIPETNTVITKLSSANTPTQLQVSPENARRSVMIATDFAQKNNQVLNAQTTARETIVKAANSPHATIVASSSIDKPRIASGKLPKIKLNSPSYLQSLINDADAPAPGVTVAEEKSKVAQDPISSKIESYSGRDDESSKNISGSKVGDLPPAIDDEQSSDKAINWLQEIAAIKLTTPKKSSFNIQFYFSPMVSYRKLVDNSDMKFSNSTLPSGMIDRFVDHKPSIGAEMGSNVLYSPLKNLTIKTGVQLNYSRYTIKAFKSYVEKASIALNSITQHTRDTMVSYTTVRNFNGYSPEVLENQYLQISVPVGAELVLLGNKKLQFSVAGTIQPTYLIFNDSYLLTTDYVHYTKEPTLIRKWNLHTSAEAFVSYQIGSLRWQVGPQFRYQLMSSYHDQYPIKEYLMEYGIKFGLSKTLK